MIHRQETVGWAELPGQSPAELPTVRGYEVLAELGRGGMGVVYRARQASSQRLVALKLIRDGALAGPQDRARFWIEAEAAARMQHPHIVQIYEVAEHGGLPYFAMELVEGGSLEKLLPQGSLESRLAAGLVHKLAQAIEHAHAQNIVHRDLKPANILVAADQWPGTSSQEPVDSGSWPLAPGSWLLAPGCLKITDFGLAKRLDGESTAWTQPGVILGTASYMAPEQAAGRVGAIGPATDIFALGAILYELLTGRPPFQAETWNQTLLQVLHDEPQPPTRLNSAVPRDLEAICLQCLEKEPQRRYSSAGDLAADLNRFLTSQPVAAVPLSDGERLARRALQDGYTLVERIGTGPRSTVWRALYGSPQQTVALKVYDAGICTEDQWRDRLNRGADLWSALAHPQLAGVQRAGWWDGAAYVSMDYVPQGSLADRLAGQDRPGPLKQALQLVAQLAEIVGYLHRQGVVHGNLKSSNVLLAADGIARLSDLRLTGGLFQGSAPAGDDDPAAVACLAPELLENPHAELRPYTDIYGLGIVLYELLTGRLPFAGTTAGEVRERIDAGEFAPPSALNPDVTPRVESVCLRCLKTNPWRRYHRVYDLQIRLQYLSDNPGGPLEPREWWLNRRPPQRGPHPR